MLEPAEDPSQLTDDLPTKDDSMTMPFRLRAVAALLLWAACWLPGGALMAQSLSQLPAINPLRDSAGSVAQNASPAAPSGDAATGAQQGSQEQAGAEQGGEQSPGNESDEGDEQVTRIPKVEIPERERLTAEEIEARRESVSTLNLSEAQKNDATTHYQRALQLIAERESLRKQAEQDAAAYQPEVAPDDKDGPKQYTKAWYETRLARPIEQELNLQPVDLDSDPTAYLEERAAKREERANFWRNKVAEIEARPSQRRQFFASLPEKVREIEQKLAEVAEDLDEIGESGIDNEVTRARYTMLVERERKLAAEMAALRARQGLYQRQEALHDLELELAKRRAAKYAEVLAEVRSELSRRRQQAANRQAQAARQQAERHKQLIERNPESLGTLARQNQGMTRDLQERELDFIKATAAKDEITQQNNLIASKFAEYKSQFADDSELSPVGGQLLREQRDKLPHPGELRAEIARHQNVRNDISFFQFAANLRLEELEDLEAKVAEVLKNVRPEDRAEAEPVVRSLLASQQQYLPNYIEALKRLDTELAELIVAKKRLLENTSDFRDFIAKRDLWIRSCRPLWVSQIGLGRATTTWRPFYVQPAISAVKWSFDPANWIQAGLDLQSEAYRQPFFTAIFVVAFALLLYGKQKARTQIRELGELAAQRTCTEFRPSIRVLLLTFAVSLPWPLLLWGISWLLEGPLIEAEFTQALSHAIRFSAAVLLLAEFLRQSCRANGLAEAHLGWPRGVLLQLRRFLRFVPVLVAPLVLWIVGLDAQTTQSLWSASLGRVLFLLVMAYATFVLWRLLMSSSSSIYQTLDRGTENWLLNLHRAWRPMVVAIPVCLGVLAALGYYYTASELTKRTLATAAMLLGIMIAGGLLRRWVLLSRRRLAREQARERRAQATAAAADGDDSQSLSFVEVPEEIVDLAALGEQTRKLLRAFLVIAGVFGAIVVWRDVLPAFSWLDDNPLPWLADSNVDNPMTWGHLLRSAIVLLITYIAARDLPSLLELVVLQHLPVDQGARYAITTLSRYALITVGIVAAASALNITGNIGWLIAAMGVGLGFGLQEIFANFVSGIILLFERPIRVGDIITLGDKSGVVSRIRMRATTITDWDRKEYIVPNKDLVTERLLNWTLSDPKNRVTVEVGIAYGSDTDRACELLREVANDHPVVLEDPAPLITFEGFGDSTLNLVLRCYLPDLEKRLATIHDLHTEVNKRFNAEGIEIAFPQRDLHLRSVPQGWESLSPAAHDGSNGQPKSSHTPEPKT